MLRNQGVRAVFRVFLGGILLLGANAVYAQTDTISVSPAASGAQVGTEITFSGAFPATTLADSVTNAQYRLFRCNNVVDMATAHTNIHSTARTDFGNGAAGGCSIISTAGMNGFGTGKSRTLPTGNDAPKYTLVSADLGKHLYFAVSNNNIFSVAPVYSPPAPPPAALTWSNTPPVVGQQAVLTLSGDTSRLDLQAGFAVHVCSGMSIFGCNNAAGTALAFPADGTWELNIASTLGSLNVLGRYVIAQVGANSGSDLTAAFGPIRAALALDALPSHENLSGSTYTFESGSAITDIDLPSATTNTGSGDKTYTLVTTGGLPMGLNVVARVSSGAVPDVSVSTNGQIFTATGENVVGLSIRGTPDAVSTATTVASVYNVTDDSESTGNVAFHNFSIVVNPPPVPANLAAAPSIGTPTSSGLPLSWTKPTGATGFKVYADTNANFTADADSLIKTLDLDADADGADCESDDACAYSVPHADLTAGADNYFRVVPTNIGGDAMMPSAVSVAWASPAVLLAPSSGLTATFIAGTSEGSWQAPTGSGGLGDLEYGLTNLPNWLEVDASDSRSLRVKSGSSVPAVNASVPNIDYAIRDLGGRDSEQTTEIIVQINPPGPLTFAADIRAGAQNYDTGATVEIFSLGNASGGSGGSRTYTLRKIGGSAADLAALGLEAVAGSPLTVLANTGDGDAVSYQTATPISIRSIADTPTRAGSITLRYGVSDSAGAAPTHYDFAITVGSPPPAAASGGGGGSGAIVALVLAGGAYFWWKKRQIASGNAAKMAVLPDVSFDLDRNDRRAFYTKFNWQNLGNSNWQIRSNLQIHTKYSGKLLDWNANSHIGYRLNGKFGDFNPYAKAKFVANDPENAKMLETYTVGVNYAIPNRFSVQFLQPDDEIWRYSLKTEMHLPKGISLRFNQPSSDIWRYSANLNWQISERIGLNLSQPNNDLDTYGFGVQWRNKSKIRYGLHGETGNNAYRFTGSYAF